MQTWGITKTAVTQLKFACPWHSDATASEISKMEVVHLTLLVPRKRSPLLQTLVDFSILIFFLVALGFRISYYASVWNSVGSGNYTCPVHNHCVVQTPNVFFLVYIFSISPAYVEIWHYACHVNVRMPTEPSLVLIFTGAKRKLRIVAPRQLPRCTLDSILWNTSKPSPTTQDQENCAGNIWKPDVFLMVFSYFSCSMWIHFGSIPRCTLHILGRPFLWLGGTLTSCDKLI